MGKPVTAASSRRRDFAPQPAETLRGRYPSFALKPGLRWAFDRFQSDRLTEWALKSDSARSVMGRLYFHKRSAASDVLPAPGPQPSKPRAGTDRAG